MISLLFNKKAIVTIFSILLALIPSAGAWVSSSLSRNVRLPNHPIPKIAGNIIHANKFNTIIGSKKHNLSATQLSLFIKYKDKSDDELSESIVQLSPDQDQLLRDVASSMEEAYGMSWFEKEASWEELKSKHTSLLQEFSNDELRRAYIAQKPKAIDLLLKTPLGPFLLVNLLFLLGGFSWCDTPFLAGSDTCLP